VQDKYENLKVQLLKQKEYSDHVHLEYQKLEAQLEQRTGQQAEEISGSSVADPGWLSRILIFTHLGSWIPDPKKQKRGVKKITCFTFFVGTNFTKIENYFIFEMLKKKMWSNFRRIIELLTQKIVIKLSKI
jgi:hypothetical protein